MATKSFKSTADLLKYVKSKGADILQEIIDKEVVPELMYQIQDVVYNAYDPVCYQRRYNENGLGDIDNIMQTKSSDGLKIQIKNIAKSSNKKYDVYLDVFIVEGTHYWSGFEKYQSLPFPRDFYKATREAIELVLPQMAKQAFERRGIKATIKKVNIKTQ